MDAFEEPHEGYHMPHRYKLHEDGNYICFAHHYIPRTESRLPIMNK